MGVLLFILAIIIEIIIGGILFASDEKKGKKTTQTKILGTIGLVCLAYQIISAFFYI
jgi:hypothetical protein